jgi:hypothetical protein
VNERSESKVGDQSNAWSVFQVGGQIRPVETRNGLQIAAAEGSGRPEGRPGHLLARRR